jgi:glycosyltransferase involved in cell wall biosynthesis
MAGTLVEEYYGLRISLSGFRLACLDLIHLTQVKWGWADRNPLVKMAGILTIYSFFLSLAIHLLRNRYDLIYVRSIHGAIFLSRIVPALCRRSVCFELHAIPGTECTTRSLAEALRRMRAVVAVTRHLRDSLIGLGIPAGRILTAHDAVDFRTFDIPTGRDEARRELGIPTDATVAAFVGKFHTNGMEKGIPEILESAEGLLDEFPALLFYFVGGPREYSERYAAAVRARGMDVSRFVFLDKQPIARVPLFLKASDILLMPHPRNEFYAYHVSPLKMFEYMSAGRPIVASNLPAIEEVLEDGRNAYLGEAGDPRAIAENIRRILRDPRRAAEVGARARAEAKNLTWARRAPRILDWLEPAPRRRAAPVEAA